MQLVIIIRIAELVISKRLFVQAEFRARSVGRHVGLSIGNDSEFWKNG